MRVTDAVVKGRLFETYRPSSFVLQEDISSRKNLRTKVTPDFHLTYSENGENLGSGSK